MAPADTTTKIGTGAALSRPFSDEMRAVLPRPFSDTTRVALPRPFLDVAVPGRRAVVVALCGLGVAGCAGRLIDARPLAVDGALGATLTSDFRAQNGLPPVSLDARLSRAAADQALAMARHDDLSHSIGWGNALPARLAAVDYDWEVTAENIGMGYRTLQAAFDGWVGSAGHRANLLKVGVTQVGFGAAEAPASRSRFFWAMILATPRVPRGVPVEG